MGKNPNPLRRLTGRPNAIRAHVLARSALIELLARDPSVVAIVEAFDIELSDVAHQLLALVLYRKRASAR